MFAFVLRPPPSPPPRRGGHPDYHPSRRGINSNAHISPTISRHDDTKTPIQLLDFPFVLLNAKETKNKKPKKLICP
jgi:hypothetical protein